MAQRLSGGARCAILALATAVIAPPAFAQRFPFEQVVPADGLARLDARTVRGEVRVGGADSDRVVIRGSVTVRVGLNVPVNAPEIAARLAAAPPVTRAGDTVSLRIPSDPQEQRAVTVSYTVVVPRQLAVSVFTESGAVNVHDVDGAVSLRTQSSAIDVTDLRGSLSIDTQSGDVEVSSVAGDVTVTTGSSRVSATALGAGLRVRTESGAVGASLRGSGKVDVRTGSSEIRLRGVGGALNVVTRSGRVTIDGRPGGPWDVETGSSAISLTMDGRAGFDLDARTGSKVRISGGRVDGTVEERAVRGTVRGGGPLVRAGSRSGAIDLVLD